MKTILILSFLLFQNIYSLHFNTSDGNSTSMQAYQGKKILLVNIASASGKVNQLQELQQLAEQYKNTLVVLAFPSNSFGNEPRTDLDIRHFCDSAYHITFTIAAKNDVAGPGTQPVYNWLSNISNNGIMQEPVIGDFQKYLVSEDGMLIGSFSPSLSPLDTLLTSNLTN